MNRILIKTTPNLGCTWEPVLERSTALGNWFEIYIYIYIYRERVSERKREREKGRMRVHCCNYYSSEGMATNASWLSLYLEQLCSIIFLFTSKAARAFQWCRASVIVITRGNLSKLQASDHRGEWSVMKWFHIHVKFDSFRTPWHSTANPMVPQIKIKDNTFTWNAPPQPFTTP